MSTQWAAPFGTQTPAAYNNVALGLIYNGVSSRSMRHPSPTDRDFHAAGGAFRHADARGLFIAWRSSYYNGVSSRSMRHPSADRPRCPSSGGTPRRPNARGGFRPANAARTPPHFFPTCDAQEANLFIQVSVKSISASCRRTHRPPLRAVGHRPAGIGAVCSSFLSAPRRRDSNGPFFHLQVLPVLAAPPAPLQASAPVALPRPPLGGRSPTTSAAQSPESRLCGGLSASIHPLHPPHRPCPKIIVLRSASL